MGEPLENDKAKDKPEKGLLDGPGELLASAAYNFVQAPIDGVTQLAGKITHQDIKAPQLVAAPKEQNYWTTAGSIIGQVAEFVAVSKVLRFGLSKTGAVAARAPLSAWESGLSGATMDFLHPVGKNENNYWLAKARNAGVAFGTFAAMTGSSNLLTEADVARRAGRRSLAESIGLNAFTGVAGGMTNAELDALGHGKLAPEFHKLYSTTTQYAAFGALFGAADVALNRGKVEIKPAENARAQSGVQSSEAWVRAYDGSEPLKSPLLSWIAENKPELRPPGYEAYKAQIARTPSTELEHLDLAAWPAEQRPRLLTEIRGLASGTQLSLDSNIDAFISRINLPEVQAYADPVRAAARSQAYTNWAETSGRLDTLVQSDPQLRDMSWSQLIKSETRQGKPELDRLINETAQAETAYKQLIDAHMKETNIGTALTRALNGMAQEAGLPKLSDVKVTYGSASGLYGQSQVSLGHKVLDSGLSSRTADTALHEFVHHDFRPGFLRGLVADAPPENCPVTIQSKVAEELTRLSTPGGTFDLLKRLGDAQSRTYRYVLDGAGQSSKEVRFFADYAHEGKINTATWDEAAISKTVREFLESRLSTSRMEAWQNHMKYVGSYTELPAWATGFLTRIRSRALGLPDPDISPPSTLPDPVFISEIKPSKK